jgi:cell division protein ZapE
MFGSVGRGKTELMNLFFASLEIPRKSRFHFSDFMKNIHAATGKRREPLDAVANSLATEFDLICLDELAISDIQDAVVFPRVLSVLLLRGVSVVMTSNRHPNELYESGLNRHLYLPPLIEALKLGSRLVNLDFGGQSVDYREVAGSTEIGEIFASDEKLLEKWRGGPGNSEIEASVSLSESRRLAIFSNENGVRLDFNTLCSESVSELDFVTIADACVGKRAFLFNVPITFTSDDILTTLHRFGKFIEICYDKKISLSFAFSEPEKIFDSVLKFQEKEFFGMQFFEISRAAARASKKIPCVF